jgi:tartrate dehydratase beta subunit/fumarate hydratase class I family protein
MPDPAPRVGRLEDTVPPMPQADPNHPFIHITPADVAALRVDAANAAVQMQEAAKRITEAAKIIQAVAPTTTVKLTRKDKLVVAGACLGMVGVGVGGTLLVQSIRRGRAARRMTTTTATR